jgi:hypothetical protein
VRPDTTGMLFIAVGTLLVTLSVALLAWSLPKVPTGGE